TPRVGFHWPGVVASQIGMDAAGIIRTFDNPGTSYERFAASSITSNYSSTINTTTPGLATYNYHLAPTNLSSDYATGITFGSTNSATQPQAGIYVQSSGSYGTKMYFGTTDAYVTGSKTRMTIDHLGNVGIGTTTPGAALSLQGDRVATFGPNSGWAATLRIGGNGGSADNNASIATTNGNMHIDPASGGFGTYINWYKGTGGINFGNGATTGIGSIDNAGNTNFSGYINSSAGFRVGGAAPAGQYLRGNGTNFVSSAIQAGDISALGFIPNNGIGDWQIASSSTSTGYGAASLELRESNFTNTGAATPPHLGFHWGGVVASNIAIESSGRIAIRDNPGTGYENFIARDITASGVFPCIQGNCPSNGAIRLTPNFHINAGNGYGVILNWDQGTSGATQTFRIGNGAGSDVFYVYADGQAFTGNWWRSNGQSGWYSQSYGGGWWMTDASYLRTYNDKTILATGGLVAQGTVSTAFGAAAAIYANNANTNGGGIMVSDDGGFFDYNDAWIQFRGSLGVQFRSNNATNVAQFNMSDALGTAALSDKRVLTGSNAWGVVGVSGQAWYQMWAYSFNNASQRELKKDITKVDGSIGDLVMQDLDKMNPYMYRYKVETDEWNESNATKFRSGVHMGLILDEAPDYIQSQSYTGVDVYAVATLGVAAGKYNREEIKQIKQSIGLNDATMTVQDFGSKQLTGSEMVVSFDSEFAGKLGGVLPVVTVTANTPGVTLSIVDKTANGFKVVSSSPNVSIDYIAMAKVKNTLVEKKEAIAPEVMSRIRVPESEKKMVQQYWAEQPEKQKELEGKAGEEAIGIAATNLKKTALPEKYEHPELSGKHVPNDPTKAPGYYGATNNK
ncbi:MAG TPA: hypothetical protein VK174_01245, partial [Chitinophagales bacterium]|nr:hypothetical protein [Chitinophagales bacterium]